jgi:hypothetical protein
VKHLLALLLAVIAAPATANVVAATDNGLEVREVVNLVVPPADAFAAFRDVPNWWDPAHTYSGDSANLSLNLVPGGCFCERFPKGGGIEHLRVAYVEPGSRVILTGSLGPLLYEATTGVMDVQVKRIAGGSQLILDYRVSGFANGGAAKLAPAVDEVLAGQIRRLRAYASARPRS